MMITTSEPSSSSVGSRALVDHDAVVARLGHGLLALDGHEAGVAPCRWRIGCAEATTFRVGILMPSMPVDTVIVTVVLIDRAPAGGVAASGPLQAPRTPVPARPPRAPRRAGASPPTSATGRPRRHSRQLQALAHEQPHAFRRSPPRPRAAAVPWPSPLRTSSNWTSRVTFSPASSSSLDRLSLQQVRHRGDEHVPGPSDTSS